MKQILIPALAISLLASQTSNAAVSDEDFEQLRQQLAAVSARLEELAAENAELRQAQTQAATEITAVQTSVADVTKTAAPAATSSWPDRISPSGDFRYRYERISPEGSSARKRNRIRARINLTAEVSDDVEVGFGLATGGDDPVSSNQTLGGGGSSKSVVIDLAYVDWSGIDGTHVLGGKFKNPLLRVGKQPLMWDGDWRPEGIAVTYERGNVFVNGIGTFLESDSRRGNDSFSWGTQIGATGEIGDVKLTGGVGYYSINTKGNTTTYGDPTDPDDFFGNTAVQLDGQACGTNAGATCVYLYDYRITQVFAEAGFAIGDWPASVFLDYVSNGDASDHDTGWTVGGHFGKASEGRFGVSYYYADKEADALLGLLTDSDFAGGGTDNKGHSLKVSYGIAKNWTVGLQYFMNETGISSGNESDYDRYMLDMQWKWK